MAKLFTSEKIRKIDSYTIAHEPVASIDLMERAAKAIADWITQRFDKSTPFIFFAGPGNNGGDALALARLLFIRGYENSAVFPLMVSPKYSPDFEINLKRLKDYPTINIIGIQTEDDFPAITKEDVIIDGLFGSGLTRPLDGVAARLVRHIVNAPLKAVIAIDIPSGLFGEDNKGNQPENIIKATYCLTLQFPKISFFFPENDDFIGDWSVLDIGLHKQAIEQEPASANYIAEADVRVLIKDRKKYSHKGVYGHALLIAGSYGMMGAAVLSARATVRSGAGLLTTHIPRKGVDILHASVPESLTSIDASDTQFSHYPVLEKFTAVGIGPGIGQDPRTKEGLIELLQEVNVPLIIDADGLNLLSTITKWKDKLPKNTILTPHPKEYERLFGKFPDSYSRLQAQLNFSSKHTCVIVLKGAHTCITDPDGKYWFNTTGNPGMAKGGSGDVLTGLILGLLAQGYSCSDASVLAVYIHGLAGDLASIQYGQYSMIPSDIIDNIGNAFNVIIQKKS